MKRNNALVLLIMFIFFVISFLTNILGPLIPDIITGFDLSLALAGFLPFSFFIAYGVMSIPSGILVEKYGEKAVMVAAFVSAFIGALLFSLIPVFAVAMFSLFLIGVGMAMLQVAINPLLRVAGGEEHFAFNSVMAQLAFGAASFISPFIYSYLVTNLNGYTGGGNWIVDILATLTPEKLPWVSLYWVFALVSILMVPILMLAKLPEVELKDDEKAGAWQVYGQLFKNKTVILYFFGIFAYVGTEQGVANWISKFLSDYHGLDPQTVGASAVAWFWGLLTAGCLLGLLLLKLWDSRKVLIVFSLLAMISLTAALTGSAQIATYAFPMVGFFASVMWSIIFSLALNSFNEHHGAFSGILVTGIIGGAIVPLIVGSLGELFGLRFGMLFLYISLGYILSIGIWAKPIISNETFKSKKEKLQATNEK